MALIGSDGKEDTKDGKDDCGQITGFSTLGLSSNLSLTPNNLPIHRRFYRAVFREIAEVSSEVQLKSVHYWNQAKAMGLLDSATTKSEGSTTLIISASSVDEAKSLAEGDPVFQAGLVGRIDCNEV